VQVLFTVCSHVVILNPPALGDTIFWLNEVPCKTVSFVGIVVGSKSYENNTCIWGVFLHKYYIHVPTASCYS